MKHLAFLGLALIVAACGASGGGGGGGGALLPGGVPGAVCDSNYANQGCYTGIAPAHRVQCDNNVWKDLGPCAANEYCNVQNDGSDPTGVKKLAICVASSTGGGLDATSGGDSTGGGQDLIIANKDGAKSDNGGCVPQCDGKECGADGCGGNCGKCPTAAPNCVQGLCKSGTCTKQCANKQCGDDGCGGKCGTCSGSKTCNASGQCVGGGGTLTVGSSCFGNYSGCPAGSKCAISGELSDYICQTVRSPGQTCGPGVGDCADGSTCGFTDKTKNTMKCYADVSLGGACGKYGFGTCAAGSSCGWTSTAATSAKCYTNGNAGAQCGGIGLGGCKTGLTCFPTSATDPNSTCQTAGAPGAACGYGLGGCVDGADCVWDTSAKSSASCYALGSAGDKCGDFGTATDCAGFATCVPDSSDAKATGTCMDVKFSGDECGYGIGFCAAFLGCSYVDASQTTAKCLPALGLGKDCGIGTATCLPGLSCVPATQGATTGTCQDSCEAAGKYGDGTCDSCLLPDSDCFK